MGRIRALPLASGVLAAGLMVSGASGADPRTPPAAPGQPVPFLGTAIVGSGGLLAAVDAYGNLVDLRYPGPGGEAQIDNPFARQAAGTVAADTGLVTAVGAGSHHPLPLWHARRLSQRYLPGTNVVRTVARVGGARIVIEDAAAMGQIARRFVVRGRPGQPLALRLDVNFDLGGEARGDTVARSSNGFTQRDGAAIVRCRTPQRPRISSAPGEGETIERLTWRGRGELQVGIACALARRSRPLAALIRSAIAADRRWIHQALPLDHRAPDWARRMYARSLLVLRALTDARSGASVAGARDHWPYVWPRDAGAAAIALAAAGYRAEARRVVGFLLGLELEAGARFRGDSSAVLDGRVLPGDAVGWIRAAAEATATPAPRPQAGAWRDRGDYGERRGERGEYLANAIAGGARANEIRRLFAVPTGLQRRAGDRNSGLDSSAAWAVRPFPRPQLFGLARRTLLALEAEAGRFGIVPSQDWPSREAWTAPAAWSAWSLAVLGDRAAALRLMAMLRRSSTRAGTIPERVAPENGLPLSTTPLGWTHAFALLALRRLYAR